MSSNLAVDAHRPAKGLIAPLSRVHGTSDVSRASVQVNPCFVTHYYRSNWLLLQSTRAHLASGALIMARTASRSQIMYIGPISDVSYRQLWYIAVTT
jgi:hypothetical protein